MSDEDLALEPVNINGEIVYVNRGGELWRWKHHRKWYTPKFRKCVNKPDKTGYIRTGINGTFVLQHRIIAKAFLGLNIADVHIPIDHINRIKHDNRLVNLRLSNKQKNQFNRGAKGYTWDKKTNKWMARIGLNGKHIYLGLFVEEEDARQAYVTEKAILHVI
jgi:hypothetical protein